MAEAYPSATQPSSSVRLEEAFGSYKPKSPSGQCGLCQVLLILQAFWGWLSWPTAAVG
jgi:hypothetical protein